MAATTPVVKMAAWWQGNPTAQTGIFLLTRGNPDYTAYRSWLAG